MDEQEIKSAILKMREEDKNGLIWAIILALYENRDGELDANQEWSADTVDYVHTALKNANLPIS